MLKCSLDKDEIEKTLMYWQEEFNRKFERKLELGRIINKYMRENDMVREALSKDNVEALEIYESHEKKQNLCGITWRGWQKDLRKYLDDKCDRKVIWVIGEKGNEGKS